MKQIKRILAFALIACVVMTMSGCRYSKTLEQIIYNQYREGMIDINAPFQYAENELDNEKSDDLNDIEQRDDAERTTEQVAEGIAGESDEADTQEGYEVTFVDKNGETDAEADKAENSAEGSQVRETDQGGTPHSDEDSQSAGNTAPTTTDDTGKDGVTGNGGEEPKGDPEVDTGKGVVNTGGTPQQMPENVKSVAAVGELAAMFVILNCEEKLVATDEETAKKAQTIPAFAGLGSAEAVWESDGLAGLGEAGFNRLMELKPDLIVEISGSNTFNNEQIEKLKENGSYYYVVSEMTDLQSVEEVVLWFGDNLGDEAEQRAEKYVDWAEDAYKNVRDLTKGTNNYTLYIDGWDTGAAILAKGTVLEEGCAVINGWKYKPTQTVSAFLNYAGVTNASSLEQYPSKERGYFFPMIMQSGSSFTISGGSLATFAFSGKYGWLSNTNVTGLPGRLGFGTSYQYLLAADQDTASGIKESKARKNGMWSIYTEEIYNPAGTFNGNGSGGYNVGNEMVISTIALNGSYDVLTNPAGYSSWTQGGCESILETVWAAYSIAGVMDKESMEKYIKDFYSTFYDYELSSEELGAILEGN